MINKNEIQKAFDKYIGDFKPCYVEDIGFSAKEAVEVILKAKGVPVLAHPSMLGDDTIVQDFIKYGIRGIEAFHTKQGQDVSQKYGKMAKDHGILITGGSDCHGLGKGRILMGGVKVPYSILESLKEEVQKIKDAR